MASGWDVMGGKGYKTPPQARAQGPTCPRGSWYFPRTKRKFAKRKFLSQRARCLRDRLTYSKTGPWKGREYDCPVARPGGKDLKTAWVHLFPRRAGRGAGGSLEGREGTECDHGSTQPPGFVPPVLGLGTG